VAHIEVTNTTASTLYAIIFYDCFAISGGAAEDWIRIGDPELPLFDFHNLCDGSHQDCFYKEGVPIAPGSKITYDWTGAYAELVGGNSQNACFQKAFAPPGTYPARACARPADPGDAGDTGDAGRIMLALDAGAPDCVSFTVTLPADGSVTSTASW
jgi:hypothetical protein